MNREKMVEKAKTAIKALFENQVVSLQASRDDLAGLRDEIDLMIDMLDSDIALAESNGELDGRVSGGDD